MDPLSDLDGWRQHFPLRFELQVIQLAIPCPDALQWGVSSLGVRYSGVGMSTARFLHETLGVLRWLTLPADRLATQGRSFSLLLREIRRVGGFFENFTQLVPFAYPAESRVDVNLGKQFVPRAWWAMGQVSSFAKIAEITAEALQWGDWFDSEFRRSLDGLEPLQRAVAQRVAEQPF